MAEQPRRVSLREGPKSESQAAKEFKESIGEVFNCCESESSCKHRKSLSSSCRISASWNKVSEIPADMMQYAMESAVAEDGEVRTSIVSSSSAGSSSTGRRSSVSVLVAPGGMGSEDYDKLDDFQRAARCLQSDYKTFAALNFDRFVKEDPGRAMAEVWPPYAAELRKTAAMPDIVEETFPVEIPPIAESFHEPAAKRLPVAVVELYKANNDKAAKQLIALVFDLIACDNFEISSHWASCLEKLVESCNSSNVQTDIYPVVLERLKTSSTNGKIGACRVLRKLASRVNQDVVQKKIYPPLEYLSKDKDPTVRSIAIVNMPEIWHRIKVKDPALKLIALTVQDADPSVRVALTSTIVESVTLMNATDPKNKAYLSSVMNTIKSVVKDAYVKGHIDLLVAFSACMGRCCLAFSKAGVLQHRDTLWYLDSFLQLCRYQAQKGPDGSDEVEAGKMPLGFANFRANAEFNRRHSIVEALISTKAPGQVDRENRMNTGKAITVLRSNAEGRRISIPFGGTATPSSHLRQYFGPDLERAHECRVNAAKEFYEFMLFAKPIVDFRFGLHPLVVELMHDNRPEVRAAIGEKLLPIMEYLGPDCAVMHGELVYALSDDDLDVIQAIVPGLSKILKCFTAAKVLSPDLVTPKLVEIGGAILYCEERLNQTTFYSVHQTMLEQLNVLPFCLPGDYIYSNFVPSLFHRLRHMRQIPCRLAAANAIIIFLRHCRRENQRESIRKRIREGFAQGRSVHDRMLFLYMSKKIIELFSRKYFRDHFFDDVLSLATDPIVNIRRKVIEIMPELKNSADDTNSQKKLEEVIRSSRRSETDQDVRGVLENVLGKIGANKTALDTPEGIKGTAAPALLTFHRLRDPTDEAKEKEEAIIASLEHVVAKDDFNPPNVREKRRSFFQGTGKAK